MSWRELKNPSNRFACRKAEYEAKMTHEGSGGMRIWTISKRAIMLAGLMLGACASPLPLSSKTEAATSKPSGQVLVCTGSVNSYLYPGPAKTQSARAVVVLNKDPSLTKACVFYDERTVDAKTVGSLTDHREVCRPKESPGDHCTAVKDGDMLKIANGSSKMIVTTLELNTKSLELNYGVGFLDGGWSFIGNCNAL